jgi:hypothetical protein
MAELGHRFGVRGLNMHQGIFSYALPIALNYLANYGFLLLLAFLLLCSWQRITKVNTLRLANIALLPIILLHLLLPEYSGHDFTTLYLALPLSVWLAIQLVSIGSKWLWLIGWFAIVSCPVLFVVVNPYGDHSYNNDLYSAELDDAQMFINEPDDAVLFMIGGIPSPQTLWYAKRNVKRVLNEAEAIGFLRSRAINSGVLFEWPPRCDEFQKTKTIYLQPNEP